MPNLPWTKPKDKNPGPESSTSDPVRSASPSMLERLLQKKKPKEQAYAAHHLPGTESSALLDPRTSGLAISADRHLSDTSNHPPSTSASSTKLSSVRGKTPSLPIPSTSTATFHQQSSSQVITDCEVTDPISPCISPPAPVELNPTDAGDRPLSGSHATPPGGPASTLAQTSWKSNVVQYSKAIFKVLGELTGAPLASTFTQEMEVSAFALV
jgi:hypothetical protein